MATLSSTAIVEVFLNMAILPAQREAMRATMCAAWLFNCYLVIASPLCD